MSTTRMYWLHALSPTHAGTGRGVGYIDLPIDRDGVTGWPLIRGSSFKGVWADYYTQKLVPDETDARKLSTDNSRLLRAAFGTAGENDSSNAGALIPMDAKLVCLPVRSFRGTFAWATSAMCLEFLHRTLKLAQQVGVPEPEPPPNDDTAFCSPAKLVEGGRIYLEDLDFAAVEGNQAASNWAARIAQWVFPGDDTWQTHFKNRFVVLPDAAFDFLCETGTEVHTRIRIDPDTKTVANKALWNEETLPAESILAGVIHCDRIFGADGKDITPPNLVEKFATAPLSLQIGGKSTIGYGQMRCIFNKLA